MALSLFVQSLKSRLAQKLTLWVFLSLMVIEVVLLVPSYYRKREELLTQREEISAAAAKAIPLMHDQGLSDTAILAAVDKLQLDLSRNDETYILGGALYRSDYELVGTFGEAPELTLDPSQGMVMMRVRRQDGDRYDVSWPLQEAGAPFMLVIRHDTSSVQTVLVWYALGLGALVLIIATVVTLATMLGVERFVLRTVLALRQDLLAVGDAIQSGQPEEQFASFKCQQHDELGEVTQAFREMYNRVTAEIVERKQAEQALRDAQASAENLLLNILPQEIANRLQQEHGPIADRFESVTILFADIVDFTGLAAGTSPSDLVALLNQIFSRFDQLAEQHGLEKIKTIGDAYMLVGGLPHPRPDHAIAVAQMAMAMQAAMAQFMRADGKPFQIRIGISTGPVVAGVIGLKKFIYDLWGDAVNTASRMESHGLVGGIQVTQDTYLLLKDQFEFIDRGEIEVKGKGAMRTYLLMGAKVPQVA